MHKDYSAVSFESVRVEFERNSAVFEYDFEVGVGEFFGVLGDSGSGKSTLLNVCAGLIRKNEAKRSFRLRSLGSHSGRVLIHGYDVSSLEPGRRSVGLVSQVSNLYPHLTVEQNLLLVSNSRDRSSDLDGLSRKLRIKHLLHRYPGSLSGGEAQRTSLAKALVQKSDPILFDEPLSALDPLIKVELSERLREVHSNEGRTFIMVSHDQDSVLSLCSRIAFLRNGKILQIGTPEELLFSPQNIHVSLSIDPFFRTEIELEPENPSLQLANLGLSDLSVPAAACRLVINSKKIFRGKNYGHSSLEFGFEATFFIGGQQIERVRLGNSGLRINIPLSMPGSIGSEGYCATSGAFMFFDINGQRITL